MKSVVIIITSIIAVALAIFKISNSPTFADPEPTTPNGCTCNSLCGATIWDFYVKDWCKVNGNCGQKSLIYGYWDYCLYKASSMPSYTELDWKNKQDLIWARIIEDESLGENHPFDVLTESLRTTFENEWDVLPEGRRKVYLGRMN